MDIKGFGVENKVFISATVETEKSSSSISDLQADPSLNIQVETVFLETLIKGEKSLHYYMDANKKENFYIKKKESYDLLIYKTYLKSRNTNDPNNKLSIRENKRYLSQLASYLKDCPHVESKFANTSYSKGDLIYLFEYYFDCTQSIEFDKRRPSRELIIKFGPVVGLSITSQKFKSEQYDYLVDTSYPSSTNFTFGAFLELSSGVRQSKWSFYNELLFTKFITSGSVRTSFNSGTSNIVDTEFGYSSAKISSSVRFNHSLSDETVLFFNGGLSFGFVSNVTNRRSTVFINGNRQEGFAIPKIGASEGATSKSELGFPFGIGLKAGPLTFESRLEVGPGISDSPAVGSPTTRLYFLLGYQF